MGCIGERRPQFAEEDSILWGWLEDDPLRDPMEALMRDEEDETESLEDESEDEASALEEERHNSSLRDLNRLSRFISVKLIVVCILIAASLGRDYIAVNSPYISDLMGWSAPHCEFEVPSTSRLRLAKFHAMQLNRSGSMNESVELSEPNRSSIYPVRDVEQPDVLSEEFKVLVCMPGTEFNSTDLNITELPPFIGFPLENNTSSATQNATVDLVKRERDPGAPTVPAQRRAGGFLMVSAAPIPPRKPSNARNADLQSAKEERKRLQRKYRPYVHPAMDLAQRFRYLNASQSARQQRR